MGADQQFCLRWNNFHSNITSAFESLRDDEDFVDITLACDGRQIKAHKMVLSACSPYFRSLLKGNPCQHPIVFLKDVTFSNLSSILDFMYHGEVNVSHNELATFLKTAEALKVRGLAEDEKKKDSENYNETSSPPPPRDPPDPGSPRPEEGSSAPDTHLSDSPPPKRLRRRSGNSVHSTEDTNETVLSDQPIRDTSVKNEPQDFNEEEDILSQSVDQDVIKSDVVDDDRNFGPAESVTIRSQAAMQQLQESFGSFLPGMGQSPGFLPHGATDMPRPPPYPLEGVQGLPPGISALPGPSMSQGAASQDASQGGPLVSTPTSVSSAFVGPPHPFSASSHSAPSSSSSSSGVGGATMAALSISSANANSLIGGGSSGGGGGGVDNSSSNLLAATATAGRSGIVGVSGSSVSISSSSSGGGVSITNSIGGGGSNSSSSCNSSSSSGTWVGAQCPICFKVLRDKYKLRTHLADIHSAVQHVFTCPVCNRVYKTKNTLTNHISLSHRGYTKRRHSYQASSSTSPSSSSNQPTSHHTPPPPPPPLHPPSALSQSRSTSQSPTQHYHHHHHHLHHQHHQQQQQQSRHSSETANNSSSNSSSSSSNAQTNHQQKQQQQRAMLLEQQQTLQR